MYNRNIKSLILAKLFQGKVVLIIGARQVGKTTLANEILDEIGRESTVICFNCDNPLDREKLNQQNLEQLKNLIGNHKLIFIDEAQKVETIGQTLKLLVDEYKESRQIIATGSSSINLLDKTSEPLTGRKRIFALYPLALKEIYLQKDLLVILKDLESRLIYGMYPEVVLAKTNDERIEALEELSSSYLFKDILEFQAVKNSSILFSLLKALSLQIGSEVSYNEISNIIGIEKKTVERYVDLLEKNQIIFRLPPFAVNQRRTISKLRKIYFYDLGIRNAVINNFNPLNSRSDGGALWENFALVERLKFQSYKRKKLNTYFLRTYDGAEIDLLEESEGKVAGYEFKSKVKGNKSTGNVAEIDYKIITPENILEFLF